MAIAFTITGWFFSILAALISLLLLGMGGTVQSILLLGISLAILPPLSGILHAYGFHLTWWMRGTAVCVLYGGFMLSMVLNPAVSIYKTDAYRQRLMHIYDQKLAQWPTPYESRFVDTEYGSVHVIVSGPEDGYPVMLINASGVGGWSWIFNVGVLNAKYRTYAIDNIGEAGKNTLIRPGAIPKTGPEIAAYYTDISNKLGFSRSHVVGASIGGFIATTYAAHAPERVDRLVLLGSMGYGSTLKTVATMVLAQGIPVKPVQDATFNWAFGNAPQVRDAFGPWFRLVMKGMIPTPIAPKSLTPGALAHITAPTLAYIGTKDNVVGDAAKAAALAETIPGATVRVVESGHLIGAEMADQVNADMMTFFAHKNISGTDRNAGTRLAEGD